MHGSKAGGLPWLGGYIFRNTFFSTKAVIIYTNISRLRLCTRRCWFFLHPQEKDTNTLKNSLIWWHNCSSARLEVSKCLLTRLGSDEQLQPCSYWCAQLLRQNFRATGQEGTPLIFSQLNEVSSYTATRAAARRHAGSRLHCNVSVLLSRVTALLQFGETKQSRTPAKKIYIYISK